MATLREGLNLERSGVVSLVGAGGKTTLMFRLAEELAREGGFVLSTTTTKIFFPTSKQAPVLILEESPQDVLARAADQLNHQPRLTAAAREIIGEGKLAGFPPEVIDDFKRSGLFRWILVEADGAAGRSLKMAAPHEPVIPASTDRLVIVAGLDAVGKPLEDEWVFRSALYAEVTGLAPGDPVSEESVAAAVVAEQGLARGSPTGAARYVFLNKADGAGEVAAGRRIAELLRWPHPNRPARVVIGRADHDPPVMEWVDTAPSPRP